MKFTMDLSSDDPRKWKLLRYGEPAADASEKPGGFDNAHLEFWQRIEELEEELAQAIEEFDQLREDLVHLVNKLTAELPDMEKVDSPGVVAQSAIIDQLHLIIAGKFRKVEE